MRIPPLALELACRLRAATKAAHHDLDHHVLLAPLVTKDISVVQYRGALKALYGPQQALESLIQPTLEALGQISFFPARSCALLADLTKLGIQPSQIPLPATDVPMDIASVLGYWYVLEGSNLGGAVIAKQIAKSLPQVPMSFFSSAEGLPRWGQFWAVMADHYQPAKLGLTIEAALAGFALYKTHLDKLSVVP